MKNFDEQVIEQIEQLRKKKLYEIELSIAQKRIKWLEKKLLKLKDYGGYSPREVFNMLFLEKMHFKRMTLQRKFGARGGIRTHGLLRD